MKTEQAVTKIRGALGRMRHTFARPVFDEWMLFRLDRNIAEILHYEGPRGHDAETAFRRDATPLIAELRREHYAPGYFYFARDAEGALFDALLAVGPDTYVVFNHTRATMNDITGDPLWAKAQVHFVELSEAFAANPVR